MVWRAAFLLVIPFALCFGIPFLSQGQRTFVSSGTKWGRWVGLTYAVRFGTPRWTSWWCAGGLFAGCGIAMESAHFGELTSTFMKHKPMAKSKLNAFQ